MSLNSANPGELKDKPDEPDHQDGWDLACGGRDASLAKTDELIAESVWTMKNQSLMKIIDPNEGERAQISSDDLMLRELRPARLRPLLKAFLNIYYHFYSAQCRTVGHWERPSIMMVITGEFLQLEDEDSAAGKQTVLQFT